MRDTKIENHSITTRKYAVTYNQTLEEFPWPQGLEKRQKLSKTVNKMHVENHSIATRSYRVTYNQTLEDFR